MVRNSSKQPTTSSDEGTATPQGTRRAHWYIGSTTHRFTTEKYKIVARYATGRYRSRYASISLSVTSASATFSVISVDVIFEDASVSMSCVGRHLHENVNFKFDEDADSRTSWSSRMFPVEFDSMYRILSSISFNCFFMDALATTCASTAVSRAAAVFGRSRFIDTTRGHQRRRWVVSGPSMNRFGPNRVAVARRGPKRLKISQKTTHDLV